MIALGLGEFQSQVAILGWGYLIDRYSHVKAAQVSIAGGDSWVGIHTAFRRRAGCGAVFQSQVAILGWGYPHTVGANPCHLLFQSQVAILGWGYAPGHIVSVRLVCFNRRWRFLGGDTWQMKGILLWIMLFQSQVAILGWGYVAVSPSQTPAPTPFQSQVAILGWGYSSVLYFGWAADDVSIAGGDSWVGIPHHLDG